MTNFIILEDGTIKNNLLFSRNAVSETHGGLLCHPALDFVIPRTQSFYIKIGCHGQTSLAVLFFHTVLACPIYHAYPEFIEGSAVERKNGSLVFRFALYTLRFLRIQHRVSSL